MTLPHHPRRWLALPMVLLLALALGEPLHAAQSSASWTPAEIKSATSEAGTELRVDADGQILLAGEVPETDVHLLDLFCPLDTITAISIEALPHASLPHQGPGCCVNNGNFVLTEFSMAAANKFTDKGKPVSFLGASCDHEQKSWGVGGVIDGNPHTGWAILPRAGDRSKSVFELRKPVSYRGGANMQLQLEFKHGHRHVLGHYRIVCTDHPSPAIEKDQGPWGDVQKKINLAIDKGAGHLLTQQLLDGSFPGHADGYPTGETALVLYTLIKCGVKKDDQCVQRAAAYMRARMPIKTYEAACQVLAYSALDDPGDDERVEEIAQMMVEWQKPNGGYGYPDGHDDLSNTQYAALALWTAAKRGAKIPTEVWSGLTEYTQTCSRGGKSPYDPLGFSYRPGGNPTGSMTAAGVAVAAISEQMGGRRASGAGALKQRGINWLTKYFSVTSNATEDGKPSGQHLLYYLYGLERVGALAEISALGSYDWYREGARHIVDIQRGGGEWGGGADSCFALLFLARATKSLTGGGGGGRSALTNNRTYGDDNPRKDVNLRAAGGHTVNFWLSSFGVAALEDCRWEADGDRGLRVKEVEYLYWRDGQDQPDTLAAMDGDPKQPHGTTRFPAQHRFAQNGKWWVMAEVTVILPEGEGEDAELILESEPLEIEISGILDPKLLEYASDASRNLLNRDEITVSATSQHSDHWAAPKARDDRLASGWLSADDDERPKITISMARPTRGNYVLLTPAAPGDRSTRPKRVKITVNGKISGEIDMELRDDRKTEWEIPKNTMIRRIEVEVLDRHAVAGNKKGVGFAEIELQRRR